MDIKNNEESSSTRTNEPINDNNKDNLEEPEKENELIKDEELINF